MTQKSHKKKVFLKVLEAQTGNISAACRGAAISRKTFYRWRDRYPAFAEAVEDTQAALIDTAESKLHQLIGRGDTTALIFFLKCKGKERGYNQGDRSGFRTKVPKESVEIITDLIDHKIAVSEAALRYAKLGLPLPEPIKILLVKSDIVPETEEDFQVFTDEELDSLYEKRMKEVYEQRKHFVPQRRAEVAEMKKNQKALSSFDPGVCKK